jgi:tetratricopeptide (TPR) repeat protein
MNFVYKSKKSRAVRPNVAGFGDIADSAIFAEEQLSLEQINEKSDTLRLQGCGLAEAGKFEEALNKWERAIGITPDDHRLHELKAQGYLALDMIQLALQSAERAVALEPDWVDGLQSLARCQREIGEIAMSLETYQTAHMLDPEHLEVKVELLEVQFLVQQLEVRRQTYLEKMQQSVTEDESEANRCIYHLSIRVPPVNIRNL